VATNFLLGITANCCHRWSKASEEEEIWCRCLSSLHAADCHCCWLPDPHPGWFHGALTTSIKAQTRLGN
jgi:hypothetical protein